MKILSITQLAPEIVEVRYSQERFDSSNLIVIEHYIGSVSDLTEAGSITIVEEIRDIEDLIGSILHAIQQGVSEKLIIHGHEISAILMDQTGGRVSLDEILKTDHPERPYQRLRNILSNNYEV